MAVSRIHSFTSISIHRRTADFLRIDSEVGLTFSGIALVATDRETRGRTTNVARKAYDTITRLRERIVLTDAEEAALDHNLLRLKGELQSLGQVFDERRRFHSTPVSGWIFRQLPVAARSPPLCSAVTLELRPW